MFIRKIKKKYTKNTKKNGNNFGLILGIVFTFILSFFVFKYLFIFSGKTSKKDFFYTQNEKIYDIGRSKGKKINIKGYAYPYIYKYNNKKYYFYILYTKEGIKYIIGATDKGYKDYIFFANIKGEIKNFIGSIPYIYKPNIVENKKEGILSGEVVTKFDKIYRTPILKQIIENYYTPIVRQIPKGGMNFSSYKGYTMYFPRKIYYEVILTDTNLGVKGLYCDNAVLVVGKDKKKFVVSDKSYIRNNARLKIFVCSYSNNSSKNIIPPQIKGMQYMTTKKHNFHFYIKIINPIWKSIANKIAVREN